MFMLPPWLRLMDFQYNEGDISAKLGDFKSHLSMAPSDYFKRNIGIGASCVRRADIEARDEIGLSSIMWGSDFPASHDRNYAQHVAFARTCTQGFSGADQERFLSGTALEIWPELG